MDITKVIVSVAVAIVIVLGVLVPVVGNISETGTVYGENVMDSSGSVSSYGRYRYAESFTATSIGGKSVDGESLSDVFAAGGGHLLVTNMGVFSTAGGTFTYYAQTIVSEVTHISLSQGTLSYIVNGVDEPTIVSGVHWAYLPDGNGPYIQTPFREGYYVNADSQIVQFIASSTKAGVAYGTATDRICDGYWVNGVSDPSQISGTFVPIQKGYTTVYGIANSMPTTLIIPETYMYADSVPVSGVEYDLIQAIPLIVILSIILGVVTVVIGRRS